MNFGSLFSGVGGLDLGLERAGWRCAWQVEVDDYARKVLRRQWPDVPKFTDVRSVGSRELAAVDFIAGGFPCQDVSSAGTRLGLAGRRSGLWREFDRIIGEREPRGVLIENVAVLRSRGLDTVLGDLAARGYDAEWDCLPAACVGAPHLRDRLFVVGWQRSAPLSFSDTDCECVRIERQRGRQQQGQRRTTQSRGDGADRVVADTDGGRLEIGGAAHDNDRQEPQRDDADGCRARIFCRAELWKFRAKIEHWRTEPGVGRVAHGVPSRVDRLTGLGNAVVPFVAEFIGHRINAVFGVQP